MYIHDAIDNYQHAATAFCAARQSAKAGRCADAGYWFDIGRRAIANLPFDTLQLNTARNSLRMPTASAELNRCRMLANEKADLLTQDLAGYELRENGILLSQRSPHSPWQKARL